MKERPFFFFFISLSLLISACAGSRAMDAPQAELNAQAIRGGISGHDFGAEPGGAWINDANEFASTLARLDQVAVNGGRQDLHKIDFSSQGVLLLWMGDKPTGGYAIELEAEKSYIRDHTAFVSVHWIEPAPTAMVTQVRTAPFLMVGLNKGGFRRIMVIDQQGRHRMTVDINRGP
jgi:hypothetical protein